MVNNFLVVFLNNYLKFIYLGIMLLFFVIVYEICFIEVYNSKEEFIFCFINFIFYSLLLIVSFNIFCFLF